MLHRSFATLAAIIAVAAVSTACPAEPPTSLALPAGLPLGDLSEDHRKLLRVTLAVSEGALAESDVVLDLDDLTLSGDLTLDNVGGGGERVATLRVYGREAAGSEEVLLGEAVDDVEITPKGHAFLDFADATFESCAAGPDGACALLFDRNRNGRKNLDDLIADVDPAPQASFLAAAPTTLQFPSGIRTGSFARQVVVVENSGAHAVRITRVQVAGGQGVGVSIFDPDAPAVDAPRRALDEDLLDTDDDGASDFVIAAGDEAFIAVSFAPVNGFLTTAALQVSAVDVETLVPQAARTKVIANADGSLRPRDPLYVEPDLSAFDGSLTLGGGTIPARAFPAAQLFSGAEIASFDAPSDDASVGSAQGLAHTGQAVVVDGLAMPADGAFVVDVGSGARFTAALAGLSSDIDLALLSLDDAGAVTGVLQTSRQAGDSAEAVEIVNTASSALRVAVVVGRVELEAPPALAGALSVDERAPFRLTCQLTKGPELDDVDPVVPARGPLGGGVPVTLRGRGFFVPDNAAAGPHVRVTFGGVPALGVPVVTTAEDGSQTVRTLLPPGNAAAADVPSTVVVENPSVGVGDPEVGVQADGQAATLPDGFRYDLPTPRLVNVTPDTATIDGGAIDVVVSGAFFFDTYGAPEVVFDGVAVEALLVDAATLIVRPPPHADGLATVSVRNIVSSGEPGEPSNILPFFYVTPSLPQPAVTGVDVATGSADGGTVVVVSGANFADGARVYFGGAEAAVTSVTATAITVTTPRVDAAGAVDVLVQNTDGQVARLASAFVFTLPPPSVQSAFPDRAIDAGGAVVVVTGAGFRDGTSVRFAGGAVDLAAANVVVSSSTTLIVTTPSFPATGPATLTVQNPDGQSALLAFTFFEPSGPAPRLVAIDPQSGDVDGGDLITLLGSNLVDPTVIFGDRVVADLEVEAAANGLQRVRLTAPPGAAGAAVVTLVNGDGQSDSITFVYVDLGEARALAVTPSVVHARIPGDEILVFGERLTLLSATALPTATAVGTDGVHTPLTVTAFGDTLARLVITEPLPPGPFVVELAGANDSVTTPTIQARAPNVVRVEVNGLNVLMIGDNLAGEQLTSVALGGLPCTSVVADERLLTCDIPALPGDQAPRAIDLDYDGFPVRDTSFTLALGDDDVDSAEGEGEGEGEGGGEVGVVDPRCDVIGFVENVTCDGPLVGGYARCQGPSVPTWLEAHCACQQNNMDLIIIDDAEENALPFSLTNQGSWIGLENLDGSGDYGKWVDGSQVLFSRMPPDPPAGKCVIASDGPLWQLADCELASAPPEFICEPVRRTAGVVVGSVTADVWPGLITVTGAGFAGQDVQLRWQGLVGAPFEEVVVLEQSSSRLVLDGAGLVPGPWTVCVGAECQAFAIDPPSAEVEGAPATGALLNIIVTGSTRQGDDDGFFFRTQQTGSHVLRLQATGGDCSQVVVVLDGVQQDIAGCGRPDLPFVSNTFDEHFVSVVNFGPSPFSYSLSVTAGGGGGGSCFNGIIDPGESCDSPANTCDNCQELDEPDNFDVFGAGELRGPTFRTLTIGDNDVFALPFGYTGEVVLKRLDGPCNGLVLDELNSANGAIGLAPTGQNGECGVFFFEQPNLQRFVRVGSQTFIEADYELVIEGVVGEGEGEGPEGFTVFVAPGAVDNVADGQCSLTEALRLVDSGVGADCVKNTRPDNQRVVFMAPDTDATLEASFTLGGDPNARVQFNSTNIPPARVHMAPGVTLSIGENVIVQDVHFDGADTQVVVEFGAINVQLARAVFTGSQRTALLVESQADVTCSGCVFENNQNFALSGPGAVRVLDARAVFVDTIFETNFANNGGAIQVAGSGSVVDFVGGAFVSNVATEDGGAVVVGGGSVGVNGTDFNGNAAGDVGGDISLGGQGDLFAIDLTSTGAVADFGGSLFLDGPSTCLSCTIVDATATVGFGGAVAANNVTHRFTNSVIARNFAQGSGGGFHVSGGATLELSYATVAFNAAASEGGGVHINSGTVRSAGSMVVRNESNAGGVDCSGGSAWDIVSDTLVGSLGPCVPESGAGVVGLAPGLSRGLPGGPLGQTFSGDERLPRGNCLTVTGFPPVSVDVDGRPRLGPDCALGAIERPAFTGVQSGLYNAVAVNTAGDGASGCTLRAAIESVNTNSSSRCTPGDSELPDHILIPDTIGRGTPIALQAPLTVLADVFIDGLEADAENVAIIAPLGASAFVVNGDASVSFAGVELIGNGTVEGGVLRVVDGNEVRIEQTTVRNGTASAGTGLIRVDGDAHLAIVSSTLSGMLGGASALRSTGPVHLRRATFADNTVSQGTLLFLSGLLVEKSTLVDSSSQPVLVASGGSASVRLSASILDGQPTLSGVPIAVSSDGGNVLAPVDLGFLASERAADAGLDGVLRENGGPTRTLRPLLSTPADGAGRCATGELDQRGVLIESFFCTGGAVELRLDDICGDAFSDDGETCDESNPYDPQCQPGCTAG